MTIKASGRSALILAAGLFAVLAAPLQAAPSATASSKSEAASGSTAKSTKVARHGSRHGKKYAQRKTGKTALKSSAARKATDVADDDSDRTTAIPPSIANANAQLASAEPPAGGAAKSSRANSILLAAADKAGDTRIVAADQLNDVDRALQDGQPVVQTMAAAEPPASPVSPPAAPAAASRNESSTWDQTSLIGKIFIGFGALLTMASAARMFMA